MYPVSDEYIAARRARFRRERVTGGIKLKDGTIILVDDTVIIQSSLSVSKKVCSSTKFDIGTANCSVLEMKLVDESAYDHEFGGALVKLNYGIATGADEDGNLIWEDVPLPPFFVDGSEVTRKWNVVKITAYDPMSLLNIDYPDTIPTDSLYSALQYVCSRAGIGLGITEDSFNELPNSGIKPDFSSAQISSCLDVVMWIAQTVNCCAFVDYRGLLTFKQYMYRGGNHYDRLFTSDEIKDIKYSDTRTYLAYLQAYVNEEVRNYSRVSSWTGTDASHTKEGALILPKNPILTYLTMDEQTAVNMSYLENRSYPTRYIKMTGWVDPALELMDVAAFSGEMIDVGQIINVVTQIKWCYGKTGTIYCASVSENAEPAGSTSAVALAAVTESDSSEVKRVQPKSQIDKRIDAMEKTSRPYISYAVTNSQALTYDSIERGVLSVDFNVDGTDSDVVFAGNQLCDVGAAGTLNCIYKVDGATQDFKPAQLLSSGKHVMPHFYAMPLNKGKHNFALYVLSSDGGKGVTGIGGIVGALSGQISGLKNNAPPNENLILYFEGVPADTEISLPKYMYYGGNAQKYVDWGDGSAVEESVDSVAVSHIYAAAGNYTITIKCSNTNFANGSNRPTFSDSFNQYIKRIYFPDGANTIYWGSSTSNFANLETLVFGKSATYISWDFKTSTEITSLFIPETAITVYPSNFKNTKVSSLIIPQNVASLNGNSNLGACPSLKTFEVYGSVETGVRGSVNLQRLVIGGNVTKIDLYDGCTSLSEVEFPLPSKITEIKGSAFEGCVSLASIDLPRTVETIGQEAFYKCTSLQSIDLPDLISEIGLNTFWGCTSLRRVKIGSKLTSIGQNAFKGCTSLSEINFPDGLTTIASSAFENTGAISPEFPETLTKIDSGAFRNSGIISAHLWSNTTCGGGAFKGSGLTTLTIDDGFGTIPTECFMNTTALGAVDIPGSVAIISEFAFKGSGVTSLTLSEGLQQIDKYAFQESGVIRLTVPSTVNNIDYYAFENCDNLTSVEIGGNTKLGQYVFAHCDSLRAVDMGSTNVIPSGAFLGCGNLSSVGFAQETAIGGSAFQNCGFVEISLLGYLQTQTELTSYGGMYNIGANAFYGCKNLINVDGYEYKWNVGLKYKTSYTDGEGNKQWTDWIDNGLQESGIYDTMGATEDSVFAGTGLKELSDYPKPADTSDTKYLVYHCTG